MQREDGQLLRPVRSLPRWSIERRPVIVAVHHRVAADGRKRAFGNAPWHPLAQIQDGLGGLVPDVAHLRAVSRDVHHANMSSILVHSALHGADDDGISAATAGRQPLPAGRVAMPKLLG